MVTVVKVALVVLIALLVIVWLMSVLGIVAAMRRADRSMRERGLVAPGLFRWQDLYGIPRDASLATLNVIWFVGALAWYGLRGRPLPPPPRPWRKD